MIHIDINTDIGEGFGKWSMGDDSQLLPFVSSANVACGMHAGDPLIMDCTVKACIQKRVAVGAHPGFPDLQGFGRRDIRMTPDEIEAYVMYQIGALGAFTESFGEKLSHVKPHGALYNIAAVDMKIAVSIARAVSRMSDSQKPLILVGLAGSLSLEAADRMGIPWAAEGFCDRAYEKDGTLMKRDKPGAVLHDPETVAQRALTMAQTGKILSREGIPLDFALHTICLHSDTPGAVQIAKTVSAALNEAQISIKPLTV